MKIGALTLFKRMRDNDEKKSRSVLIAVWHWKWSLTWSWLVTWDYTNKHKPRYKSRFMFFRTYRDRGFYFQAGVRPPLIGLIHISTQPTMRAK